MKRTTKSLYLNKIKFDPNLKKGFIYHLITNPRTVILFVLTLIIGGLYSYFTLPRELNPKVNIPIVNVVTTLPGASPTDVESLITKKLEKPLIGLPSVDTINSTSSQGLSVITLQFVSSEDPDKARDLVKEKIDLVGDLPSDAGDVTVQKLDFNDQPVWTLSLVSDQNRHSLSQSAKQLQDKLESLPGIREVGLRGDEEQEIKVTLRPDSLSLYQLTPDTISGLLRAQNLNFPAGQINVNGLEYTISINHQLDTIDKVRALPIPTGSTTIPLSELADVTYQSKDTSSLATFRTKDARQNAVILDIYKTDSQSISSAIDQSQQVLDQAVKDDPNLSYQTVINFGQETEQSFADLNHDFRTTILLVFTVLFIFLGLREATSAALSVPLTFLSAFIIMKLTGITLNFLSLFSLLLALGLVVDDAIVIVQAISKYTLRFPPLEAGLLVFRDFVVPIWTTTLTTVWAFLPLLLASGIIGEFIKSIPIVVSAALMSSTTIAVLINLPVTTNLLDLKLPKRVKVLLTVLTLIALAYFFYSLTSSSPLAPLVVIAALITTALAWFNRQALNKITQKQLGQSLDYTDQLVQKNLGIKKYSPKKLLNNFTSWVKRTGAIEHGPLNFTPFARLYHGILDKIVTNKRSRYLIYAVSTGLVVLSFLFLATGLLKNEFFPKTDSDNVFVNVAAPSGYTTTDTQKIIDQIEDQIITIPEISHITSTTGRTFAQNTSPTVGKNAGYLSIVLVNADDRDRTSSDIADDLRHQIDSLATGIDITVEEQSGGPPAGADFQINLHGDDLGELERISGDFMDTLATIDGAINIDSSLQISSGQIEINLRDQELSSRGLTAAGVGSFLRTAVTGTDSSKSIQGEDELDITLTLDDSAATLASLQNLVIPGPRGSYTLSQIADLSLTTSPTSIERQDGQRTIHVTAGTSGKSSPQILGEFNDKVKNYPLPDGYSFDSGGANEENNKSVQSIIQAMGVSAILILITMVLQFGSFRRAFLVLSVIPLAVAGVFINFTIFGIPLSFPALIGVLALFGIVVNNSMMLIAKIDQNIKIGFSLSDSITDACASRLEPIVLTTLTTSFGLLPITLSDPLWRGLGGAIITGLSASAFLILFLLPALFYETFHPNRS